MNALNATKCIFKMVNFYVMCFTTHTKSFGCSLLLNEDHNA